jgi:asparaginyl-tRNA synthetase
MAEAEMAFCDHDENIKIQEELIKFIIQRVLENRSQELEKLKSDKKPLEKVADKPFVRITYDKALRLLKDWGHQIKWGEDFGAPEEEALGNHFGLPVFIELLPAIMKPFYMEPSPQDDKLVLAADLLAPEGYGELIGGSQRIADIKLLKRRLKEQGLPQEPYAWYIDLRKYGSVPHAGFGLGIERTIAWICGVPHIRECIPFPRQIHRLSP